MFHISSLIRSKFFTYLQKSIFIPYSSSTIPEQHISLFPPSSYYLYPLLLLISICFLLFFRFFVSFPLFSFPLSFTDTLCSLICLLFNPRFSPLLFRLSFLAQSKFFSTLSSIILFVLSYISFISLRLFFYLYPSLSRSFHSHSS